MTQVRLMGVLFVMACTWGMRGEALSDPKQAPPMREAGIDPCPNSKPAPAGYRYGAHMIMNGACHNLLIRIGSSQPSETLSLSELLNTGSLQALRDFKEVLKVNVELNPDNTTLRDALFRVNQKIDTSSVHVNKPNIDGAIPET